MPNNNCLITNKLIINKTINFNSKVNNQILILENFKIIIRRKLVQNNYYKFNFR